LKIHHIGYLVDNIENSTRTFESLGYNRVGEVFLDTAREVLIQLLEESRHQSMIELISPVDKDSPIYKLKKRYKNSPYHICYETPDLEKQIASMTENNDSRYFLIQPPSPAPAISSCSKVAFLMNPNIGIIELLETKPVV
jgi:methylmalonyl-CoA/ethylmalonyl-CoA epimerase